MLITLQVIQNYADQLVPSIIISMDGFKYIFNVHDGFQRFRQDQFVGQCKSSNYFFTRISPDHLSGMYCLIINLFSGKLGFNSKIYGPPPIDSLFSSLRSNLVVGNYLLQFSTYSFYSNQTLIGLSNSDDFDIVKDNIEYQNKRDCQTIRNILNNDKCRINESSIHVKNDYYFDERVQINPIILKHQNSSEIILNYVIKTQKTKRQIDGEKLKQYDIPKKDMSKFMKEGNYMLNDGVTLLKIDDFYLPEDKTQYVLIIDCPTIDYLDSLVISKDITQYFNSQMNHNEEQLSLIIHITPVEILINEKYKNLIQLFHKDCNHIFCDKRLNEDELQKKNFQHFGLIQKLNQFFPIFFPNFIEFPIQIPFSQINNLNDLFPFITNKMLARKYYEFTLKPLYKFGYFINKLYIEEPTLADIDEKFLSQYKEYCQKINLQQKLKLDISQDYDPIITFLGTGSMTPTKYRNVSSNYIEFQNIAFLLDCGEGTYGQLLDRHQDQIYDKLKKIKFIIISHYHEDHHMGLQLILDKRKKVCDDPIFIILPSNTLVFYELLKKYYNDDFNTKFSLSNLDKSYQELNINFFLKEFHSQTKNQEFQTTQIQLIMEQLEDNLQNLQKQLKNNQFQLNFINVEHCSQSYAISIYNILSNIKITYSGDLRPSKEFCLLAENSNVLIHEATFNDDLINLATRNMHSTIQEAIQNAISSNSQKLILTHFSQRYAKGTYCQQQYSRSEKEIQYFQQNTILAFDQMSSRISQLDQLVQESQLASFMLPQ